MVMNADRGNSALRALGAGLKGVGTGIENVQEMRKNNALIKLRQQQATDSKEKSRPEIERNMEWVNAATNPRERQLRMNQLMAYRSASSPYLTEVPVVDAGGQPTKKKANGAGPAQRATVQQALGQVESWVAGGKDPNKKPPQASLDMARGYITQQNAKNNRKPNRSITR